MSIKAMKSFKKRLSLVIAAVLSLTLAAVALPVSAQEIAPEHLALARKYIELTDKSGIYENALLETAVQTMRTIITQNPGLTDPTDKAITKTLDFYKGKKGDLLDQFARVYATNFSPEELQQIVAFYESPVGAKLATANASLNDSLKNAMEVFQNNLRTEFYAAVRADLKAQGFNV